MAQVFAQNIIEVALVGTLSGRPHVNVLHVHNDEGAQSDATKAQDVASAYQEHIVPNLTTNYTFQSARWRSLDPDDTNAGLLAPDGTNPAAGARTGGAAPPNVAYLVKKVSTNRPRGRRDGRMFIGGVPEGFVDDDGTLNSTLLTDLQASIDSFVNAVNDDQWGVGGGSGLAVLETTPSSRAPGDLPVTINWRPIVSMLLDSKVATQRDRLR